MAANAFEGAAPPGAITHPPSSNEYLVDRGFRLLAVCGASLIILLVAYILWKIGGQALPAIYKYHLGFLTSTNWNVAEEKFGILPEIWGTLYSSLMALLIGGFFGLTVAIFLTQDFLPPRVALVFRTIIDMLAAIPSVVFGLWGIFVVIPAIRPIANWLNDSLGWFPFFGTSLSGPGLLPAAFSQDALHLVPYRTKEAAYGMGATRWEAILKVLVPTAAGGIASAMVLGFGRALGETMALAMLIGNSNQISLSLFAPAQTLASLLASHFPEAGQTEVQALMYAALVLLAITLVVNMMGTAVLTMTQRRLSGRS